LVSQIPALVISTAAGLLVSKAGVTGSADQAMIKQLTGYPKALGLSAGVMGVMSLLPGIPFLPFAGLAFLAGYAAYVLDKEAKRVANVEVVEAAAEKAAAEAPPSEDSIQSLLKIDDLKIELGYALLPLVQSEGGQDRLTDQIKALRRQLAADMGFVMPSVRILDNVQLAPNSYIIRVKEVDTGQGQVWPAQYMVMDPSGGHVDLPGVHTVEPTFGLPATWIEAELREEASVRGFTVVDAATVVSTHLTEILKANVSDLLSYAEVQKLIREMPKDQSELMKDLVPSQITVSGIQRVLQVLLAERVSIRDLPAILEGIAEAVAWTRNPAQIAEHVRARLSRQLCAQYAGPDGALALIALTPQWEQAFADSIVGTGDDKQLAMQPSKLSEFIGGVRDAFEDAARMGEAPVLLTSPGIRPFVRSIVERFRPQTAVLSQAEVHPRARLKTVGGI
jgi:flagellar biosynthesis protein FlhA